MGHKDYPIDSTSCSHCINICPTYSQYQQFMSIYFCYSWLWVLVLSVSTLLSKITLKLEIVTVRQHVQYTSHMWKLFEDKYCSKFFFVEMWKTVQYSHRICQWMSWKIPTAIEFWDKLESSWEIFFRVYLMII